MGMFDNLKCHYPLPINKDLKNQSFQTKDTPVQLLDHYEIREDGTLWHENYDIKDMSDHQNTEGFAKAFGCFTKINKHWEFVNNFIGEIRFYTMLEEGLVEFSAYFVKGKLNQIHLIEKVDHANSRS